ncbi:MAG: sulfurtransferase [Ectothiorhodospiraceae bacterium]|nr:sulfurtransferase [Ectothiorhodospiraceae bacterium]MCH8503363.1 sulfurtransferase [Ectothiorhodospiraceae bacterium]
MHDIPQVQAQTLNQRLRKEDGLYLLDVREPWEFAHCAIAGSVNLPMGEIVARRHEIPRDRTVVCICHHGMRSLQVAAFLKQQGYEAVENLAGGVEAWAQDVDPDMPRY